MNKQTTEHRGRGAAREYGSKVYDGNLTGKLITTRTEEKLHKYNSGNRHQRYRKYHDTRWGQASCSSQRAFTADLLSFIQSSQATSLIT
jgi:hypothetical protein